ncbi:MAG: F0F1 ATP synthase subunit A [Christensenellaceae bacterium]|nr:F0F1 ATP synthase subunit A [Christensenellaceae bacterium]
MELEISLYPKPFEVLGVNVGLSVVVAWCVLAVVLAALFLVRLYVNKFQMEPKGLQNLLEYVIESMYGFARGHVGLYAEFVAPISLTLMIYVFFTTIIELFGLPPATEDLNCTIALGLCSFIMVNVTSIRFKGVRGRIRNLASPSFIVFPIKILTDMIAPFSMGIRLFANVLIGGVIMQLIYAVVPVLLPAALSAYFNVLHIAIQTFVVGLLSLTYIGEAVE